MPGFHVLHQFPELAQTHVHRVGDAILPSVIPFSSCLQSFPASGSFPMNRLCIRWPKYWSFSISPSNEYSGLISFKIDWFDLFTVQGTLKSLLQHHNLKASILPCSAFFVVQFSHQYMTIEKAIALTIWTFVGKIMSLLFNMLSRLVSTLRFIILMELFRQVSIVLVSLSLFFHFKNISSFSQYSTLAD